MSDKKKIHLLSDVDGVIVNWFAGFSEYMKEQGEFYTGGLPSRYDMKDVFPLNTSPYKHIQEYQASHHYREATLFPEVKKALSAIRKLDIPVTFITACGDHTEIKAVRSVYFEKHLPDLYEGIIFLPLGDNKDEAFKSFNDPDTYYFMIDDLADVCKVAYRNGINPILKDMEYNRHDIRFTRANDYSQVANYLSEFKNKLIDTYQVTPNDREQSISQSSNAHF